MGGRLTATSSVSKGSTFRFTAQFALALQKGQKVRGALVDLHGKRVLLIDDNATSGYILRETLQTWGVQSDTFRLPAEALAHLSEQMASEQRYSLAIIDHRMPEMGGFEAVARNQANCPGPANCDA